MDPEFFHGLSGQEMFSYTTTRNMRHLSLLFLFLVGCVANDTLRSAAIADNNTYGLARLCIGMSEHQVLAIMRHPYSKKTIEYKGNRYDVWFYATRMVGLGQSRLVPQNLTPLTFENGMLMGWGFDYYNYALKQQKEKKETPPEEPPTKKQRGIQKDLNDLKQVSMSSRPAQQPKGKAPSVPRQGQGDSEYEEDDREDRYLDEEGEKMIDDENDQNFNFW